MINIDEFKQVFEKITTLKHSEDLTMITNELFFEKYKQSAKLIDDPLIYIAGLPIRISPLYPYNLDDGRIVQGCIVDSTGQLKHLIISTK